MTNLYESNICIDYLQFRNVLAQITPSYFCIFVCDRADLVIAGVVAVSRLDVLIVWET